MDYNIRFLLCKTGWNYTIYASEETHITERAHEFVTSQILHCFRINTGINQVGNIRVAKLMQRHRKIQGVHDVLPVYTFLTGIQT
jgi:hypothetical protein